MLKLLRKENLGEGVAYCLSLLLLLVVSCSWCRSCLDALRSF